MEQLFLKETKGPLAPQFVTKGLIYLTIITYIHVRSIQSPEWFNILSLISYFFFFRLFQRQQASSSLTSNQRESRYAVRG